MSGQDAVPPTNEDAFNAELIKELESVVFYRLDDDCDNETAIPEAHMKDACCIISFEGPDMDDCLSSSGDENEKVSDDDDYVDEIRLKELEETQSDDEKEKRKNAALGLKDAGNELFKSGDYSGALLIYTEGLNICPLCFKKERAIIYSNRAAAKIKLERSKSALDDCTIAIYLDPEYLRAIVRSAVLKEELGLLNGALADWKSVLEMHPDHKDAIIASQRLPPLIEEKNEKLKEELSAELKSVGNMLLRPSGLSTENFKTVQNSDGGYSVQFVQNNK